MTSLPATRRGMLVLGTPLAAVLLLTTGCGMGLALPGTAAAHPSTKHVRLVAAVHLTKRTHLKTHAGKQHSGRRSAYSPVHHTSYSARHRYAAKLLPILDVSTQAFDRAVTAVATSPSDSSLDSTCNQYGDQITILSDEFDGVPHPWPWYSQPGYLHHNWIGIYHYMLGAINACQTAIETGDNAAAASSISDMKSADTDIHNADNYARWLTHQP